jgi:PAS domain-containing protein
VTVVIVTLVAAVGLLAFTIRSQRRELRRLTGEVDEPTAREGGGQRGDLERESLAGAVAAFEDGVVVVDARGNEVMRNAAGERFRGARHADALVEDAMRTLLGPALRGERAQRELQLFGPPREVLLVRTAPLWRRNRVIGAVAFVRDVSGL